MAHSPNFQLARGENFEVCPYDENHVVTNLRIDVHLFKCRRNYFETCQKTKKKVEMLPCPHGVCGYIPTVEMDFHRLRCSGYPSGNPSVRLEKILDLSRIPATINIKEAEEIALARARAAIESKREAEGLNTPEVQWEDSDDGDEYEWEKDSKGYTPGYNPAIKLRRENTAITPRGLSRPARRECHERNLRRQAETSQQKPKEEKKN